VLLIWGSFVPSVFYGFGHGDLYLVGVYWGMVSCVFFLSSDCGLSSHDSTSCSLRHGLGASFFRLFSLLPGLDLVIEMGGFMAN